MLTEHTSWQVLVFVIVLVVGVLVKISHTPR